MILYILTDTYQQYGKTPGQLSVRNRLEDLSGDACLVLHYSQVTLDFLLLARPCTKNGDT